MHREPSTSHVLRGHKMGTPAPAAVTAASTSCTHWRIPSAGPVVGRKERVSNLWAASFRVGGSNDRPETVRGDEEMESQEARD